MLDITTVEVPPTSPGDFINLSTAFNACTPWVNPMQAPVLSSTQFTIKTVQSIGIVRLALRGT